MSGSGNAPCRPRVLVVEDEPKVARALREGLESDDYDATVALTGEEGFYLATTQCFDLMVLDVMLPLRDGFEILASLRARGFQAPVLMLTARDAIEDRVRGLDHGADDYLVKPFHLAELLARIRALLRRTRADEASLLSVSDLLLDVGARRATRGGREIELTPREFELLEYLLRHKGRLVSREMLAEDVWRETARGTPLDNVIDVHIAHLRKKIDQGFAVKVIHTVRGVGFMVKEEAT